MHRCFNSLRSKGRNELTTQLATLLTELSTRISYNVYTVHLSTHSSNEVLIQSVNLKMTVELYDVLSAMADCLVEKHPVNFTEVTKIVDEETAFKVGGKPPRGKFFFVIIMRLARTPSL